MDKEKLDIEVEDVPLVFDTSVGDDAFSMGINYNEIGDFYTVDLYDNAGDPLIMGEKLIYGKRLWRDYVDESLPAVDLVPLDESGIDNVVNKDTFGSTVFLYIDEPDDVADDELEDGDD